MAHTGFNELPDDLIVVIFETLRHDDDWRRSNTRAWMLCCRRMYLFALPLFYQHISVHMLKAKQLLQTMDSWCSEEAYKRLKSIASLTVWIPVTRQKKAGRFNDVVKVLEKLENLKTFSLSCKNFEKLPGNHIDRKYVALLVDALPNSVVSLELDLGSSDYNTNKHMNTDHPYCLLCSLIQKRIPSLHHLRLRMVHMCNILLQPFDGIKMKPFPLRSLTIWTSAAEELPTRACNNPHGIKSFDFEPESFINAGAVDLVARGLVPKIEHLAIMTSRGAVLIGKVDHVANHVAVYPIKTAHQLSLHVDEPAANHVDPKRYIVRSIRLLPGENVGYLNDEYVGSYEELIQVAEGDHGWVQSTFGPRFPGIRCCLKANMKLHEPFQDVESFKKRVGRIGYRPDSSYDKAKIKRMPKDWSFCYTHHE